MLIKRTVVKRSSFYFCRLGDWCNGCTFEFGSKGGVSTTSFPTKLFFTKTFFNFNYGET